MKKKKKVLIIYYLVLFGGFSLFYGLVLIGSRYEQVVQKFVDRYPYIFFTTLFVYIYVYILTLKKIISTREFEEVERESARKAKENKERNLKRIKILIPIVALISSTHLSMGIYITEKIRNGIKVNCILEFLSKIYVIPFLILYVLILYYRHTKKMIKEEQTKETQ